MRREPRPPRRGAPGHGVLHARLQQLARHARPRPMDPLLPERVLAALGLKAAPPVARARGRARAFAVALAGVLGLLLLPHGGTPPARLAAAPTWGPAAPAPSAPRAPARPPKPVLAPEAR